VGRKLRHQNKNVLQSGTGKGQARPAVDRAARVGVDKQTPTQQVQGNVAHEREERAKHGEERYRFPDRGGAKKDMTGWRVGASKKLAPSRSTQRGVRRGLLRAGTRLCHFVERADKGVGKGKARCISIAPASVRKNRSGQRSWSWQSRGKREEIG